MMDRETSLKAGEHLAWRLHTNSSGSSKPEIADDAEDEEEGDADEGEDDKDSNLLESCSTSELLGMGRSAQRSEATASQISITCELRMDFLHSTIRFLGKELSYFLEKAYLSTKAFVFCCNETKYVTWLLI